jgi:pimeloyl-ACP methyl ester carboxylesterase
MIQTLEYADGQYLAYAEYGQPAGFPLLVQHGMIASIEDAELFEVLLDKKVRLVCPARPGYGESTPYALASLAHWGELVGYLVRELGLFRFDLLGMSSGAPYSYAVARRFPHLVRHVYIFSGTPALYDAAVQAAWPYPSTANQSLEALQDLAHELFFKDLRPEALAQPDIRDSLHNRGFGVAQDLKLRFVDWGFSLSDVKQKVFMQHSQADDSVPFRTALRTAELLPNCDLELLESGPHFSPQALRYFLENTLLSNMEGAP